MAETTAIGWTDHTFNPWWGCEKVSPACDSCYAERDAHRYGFADGGGNGPELWGHGSARRQLSDKAWAKPLAWDAAALAAGRPALVFCASMADVFEPREDLDESRARLWELIEDTPHLIWQLLTKRPEQVPRLVPARWMEWDWPPNAWIGTTVEDQQRADLRIPRLLRIPAPVRFLSCEPLLGPVDLFRWLYRPWYGEVPGWALNDGCPSDGAVERIPDPGLHWIIVGGESGPGFRTMNLEHARSLVFQARNQIPVYFKQVSAPRSGQPGPPDLEALKAWPAQAGERGGQIVALPERS